ncbi:MAG TPA: TonB family protein, partial [Polyangia bacterium]
PAPAPAVAAPAAAAPSPPTAAPAPAPATPARRRVAESPRDVRRVMEPLRKQVVACFRNFNLTKGTVTLSVTLAPTGRITRAATLGRYGQTPAGRCAAAAAKQVVFPPPQGKRATVTYAYRLR